MGKDGEGRGRSVMRQGQQQRGGGQIGLERVGSSAWHMPNTVPHPRPDPTWINLNLMPAIAIAFH